MRTTISEPATLARQEEWVLTGIVMGKRIRVAARRTRAEIIERRDAIAKSGGYHSLELLPPTRGF